MWIARLRHRAELAQREQFPVITGAHLREHDRAAVLDAHQHGDDQQQWRQQRPQQAEWLRLLLATGLRESREEMRLNPFGLKFLGPMAAQPLVMFNRIIYTMAVWVSGQKRFYPNWEIEKIVCIPLRNLFDPANYARYRLRIQNPSAGDILNTFPCFRYEKAGKAEILWGATYRITVGFLKRVFDFEPPDMHSLPEIHGRLGESYLSRGS